VKLIRLHSELTVLGRNTAVKILLEKSAAASPSEKCAAALKERTKFDASNYSTQILDRQTCRSL